MTAWIGLLVANLAMLTGSAALFEIARAPRLPVEQDPREAWVRRVVRTLWIEAEYADATLHVIRCHSGYFVCREGDGTYETVPSRELVGALRRHWNERWAMAAAELAS